MKQVCYNSYKKEVEYMLFKSYMNSPCGVLQIEADEEYIIAIRFTNEALEDNTNTIIDECKKQLQEYFDGKRTQFNLPLKYTVGTAFQQRVWDALREIPYGETRSYKDVAISVGSELAVRAIGGANHNNPISIVIPCHRVIGKNNKLVGYGGGLENKERLLNLEKR